MARKPTAEPTDEVGTTEVDEATLGRVLDCDAQEIRRYWRTGIIKRTAAKKYPLFPSIRFVLGHFRRLASGYGTGEAMRANAALRDSQRRLTDLRYDQLRGTLVSMAEIEALWGELIQATQFLFRSIASRMRDRAPDLSRLPCGRHWRRLPSISVSCRPFPRRTTNHGMWHENLPRLI